MVPASPRRRLPLVPLGELADVRIAGGPPMVRDEAGLLVGYVYVDIDEGVRDIGGYVDERQGGGGAARAPAASWPCRRART